MSIHSISLKNFKSIREANDIRFGAINVLIGANGSGKSNLISFFRFLKNIIDQNLQYYVDQHSGKADNFLYFGVKKSSFLEGELKLYNNIEDVDNIYKFKLLPTQDGGFVFDKEIYGWGNSLQNIFEQAYNVKGSYESHVRNAQVPQYVMTMVLETIKVFHFHDTSATASVKRFSNVNDNRFLREDAGNLGAFLFSLSHSHSKHFNMIERAIQSVAPFFNRFDLLPDHVGDINLKWLEKGSDAYRDAHYLSDGTLRFICLATLLLQPEPPATIIIDEPELGLHPSAIDKLAAMIQSASVKTQIIVSTQSIELLNNFSADDVIVVEKKDNQSVFKRLDAESLKDWLEDYTLGELWYKNVIGGKPQ